MKKNLSLFFIMALTSLFGAPTVVLFNDTSAWYHWGCTGTSTALKEGIAALGLEIHAFPINVTYALQEVPPWEAFDDPNHFHHFAQKNPEIITSIQEADAVVITGEGTIHDLRAGPRALLYLAHLSKKFLGKHVEILNHSAYPKDDPTLSSHFLENFQVEKEKAIEELEHAQHLYKTVYEELDFITIREPLSQEAMRQIGVSSTLCFDCLPLYIRDHYQQKRQRARHTALVAGSVAFTPQGVEALSRYLEWLHAKGYEIRVLLGAAAFPSQDDQAFVAALEQQCRAPWQQICASSMEEWLDAIQQASFLVSGRFHHTIAAFCLKTPFIALNSNTPKVHGICRLLGREEPLLFSDPQLFDHLVQRTQLLLSSPSPDDDEKIKELHQLAENNFLGLKQLL